MEQLFGLPPGSTTLALGGLLALILGGFALLAWRAAILVRLGVGGIPRRPARAALIVFGLALSTTTIGSAFGTGDTITHTLQSLVTQSLGTVDEVIVRNPPRQGETERVKALAGGGYAPLPASSLGFFSRAEFDRIAAVQSNSEAIAAITPAIADQVTVVHGEAQGLQTAVALLALEDFDPAFGSLIGGDGEPVRLASLADDEIVLNAAAAGAFGVGAGDRVQIRVQNGPAEGWDVRVVAVTANAGIGGFQPLVVAPLDRYGELIGRRGGLNQILVVNQGGDASVERSAAAAEELRGALVDRAAARTLRDYIARPDNQRFLLEAEAELPPRDRQRLAAIRVEATKPDPSARFVSLVSEPRTRQILGGLARNIPSGGERGAVFNALRGIVPLSVIEIKREGLDQAEDYGAVVTTVFLVLGLFSIAASILLIYLTFALLAADRGAELATMRALGMRRRQILALFLAEGIIYNLAGAALGTAGGLLATRLTVSSLAEGLTTFGLSIAPRIDPRTPLTAFAIGTVLTFVTMVLAAWRVSRTEIVAATRGEAVAESGWGGIVLGVGLLAAAALVWWRWSEPTLPYLPRHPLVAPGTLTLALLGATVGALALAPIRRGGPAAAFADWLATGTGLAIAAIWLAALGRLPTPRGDGRTDALVAAIGGLALILTTVWTATRALGPTLRGLERGMAPFRPLVGARAVVRPAAGQLGAVRWRTGLTVTMFGMIIFIMVSALTMIETLVGAYAGREAPVAGFAIRADLRASNAAPIPDIEAALAEATAVSREAFDAVGGVAQQGVQIVQFGTPRDAWHGASLAVADDGFLRGIAAGIERRAPGFGSGTAVWEAVRERPGAAVVTASTLRTILVAPAGVAGEPLAPFTIWARPTEGGRPVKLTVIGIVDARSELDGGIYVSRATAAGLGIAPPPPAAFYFAPREGVRLRDATEGLRISFADRGIVVTDLGDTVRIGQAVRALLTQLVQGFMGLGLIAGVAALGIVGTQSVIERRRQLGTLRAIGFTRWQTRATLAFESAVVAALGIALGVLLGLVLARSMVALLAPANPEIRYAVPWAQIAFTAGLAWLGALAALSIAAWQAGRVSPADALRTA